MLNSEFDINDLADWFLRVAETQPGPRSGDAVKWAYERFGRPVGSAEWQRVHAAVEIVLTELQKRIEAKANGNV